MDYSLLLGVHYPSRAGYRASLDAQPSSQDGSQLPRVGPGQLLSSRQTSDSEADAGGGDGFRYGSTMGEGRAACGYLAPCCSCPLLLLPPVAPAHQTGLLLPPPPPPPPPAPRPTHRQHPCMFSQANRARLPANTALVAAGATPFLVLPENRMTSEDVGGGAVRNFELHRWLLFCGREGGG